MRLILVRHGETKWNLERRIVGHTEIELNETGRRQAKQLALVLNDQIISAIYSSPLRRARQTADVIAHGRSLDVIVEDALKEFDAGDMNGLTIDDVNKNYENFFERWIDGDPDLRMPRGESVGELKDRAWPVVERIVVNHSDESVVVVSHTVTILTVINSALGMALADFRKMRVSVGSISVLEFGEYGVSLIRFNDTCHWESVGSRA
jgi:broad specificity phosphatase PhoE